MDRTDCNPGNKVLIIDDDAIGTLGFKELLKMQELAQRCEELGANDYIDKGGELDLALSRIRFWCDYRYKARNLGVRT